MNKKGVFPKIGNWYFRRNKVGLVTNVILLYVLSEETRNVGDPLPGKVRHMELFFNCKEYMLVDYEEGVSISILNERIRASDFTTANSLLSLAEKSQFHRWMRLLFGGRPIVEAEYD